MLSHAHDQTAYGIQDDSLLAINDILALLAREHACSKTATVRIRKAKQNIKAWRGPKRLTLDRLAIKRGCDLRDGVGDCPVLVANFDGAHGGLSSSVRSLDHIRTTTSDGVGGISTNNDGLCMDGRIAVDVRAKLDLDDVIFLQSLSCLRIRSSRRVTQDKGCFSALLECQKSKRRTYAIGEKWATTLLTDIEVGKAIPIPTGHQ